jgi:hypothetical protein
LDLGSNYLLNHIGSADEAPLYFDVSSSYIIDDTGGKSVLIRTSGSGKMQVIVVLMVLQNGMKLPPYVNLT